jgi:ribonuclease T1
MMRRIFAVLFVALSLALPSMAGEAEVRQFAQRIGLRDVTGFVEAVGALRERGRLPARFITKNDAERAGWRPGDDLCRSAPGRAIGGDNFGNREGRLPRAAGRRWFEADLDFNCGRRGARRLLFSSDGLIFVTLDHYETFRPVPP